MKLELLLSVNGGAVDHEHGHELRVVDLMPLAVPVQHSEEAGQLRTASLVGSLAWA